GAATQRDRSRHRLRWPLDEGTADAGSEARRRGRDPRRGRLDAAAARTGRSKRPVAQGASVSSWRDTTCGFVTASDVGKRITVAGWADTRREHGALVFVDLRDHTGKLQLVVNAENAPEAAKLVHDVRNEFVLQAVGEVARRAPEAVNPSIPTGEIEVQVDELRILSRSEPLPFQIGDDVDDLLRLRYR